MPTQSNNTNPHLSARPRIGLALGSGSARGWAHIGIIQGLEAIGIRPDIICGSSIGALVGAAYAADELNTLDAWVRTLTWQKVMRYMDITHAGGGFIEGKRLMDFFRRQVADRNIEDLDRPFAAVATDLSTGQEIWLQNGALFDAVRASIALPGLFTPVRYQNRWLVDGGLVNPVPVSLCRTLGADLVIAVDLNGDILGRHFTPPNQSAGAGEAEPGFLELLLERLPRGVRGQANTLLKKFVDDQPATVAPGIFAVIAGAINIMQDRITRSRMAGDPPTVTLSPHLAQIELLAFHRAGEAIAQGRACVEQMLPLLRKTLPMTSGNQPA